MIDDIRYLIVFAKIVERGSISGGAAALGLTTATASTHLSRLEKNLNSALLYRNTRKISLTQDGISLLETARSMLELYEKEDSEIRFLIHPGLMKLYFYDQEKSGRRPRSSIWRTGQTSISDHPVIQADTRDSRSF